jgi:hypothetical protein
MAATERRVILPRHSCRIGLRTNKCTRCVRLSPVPALHTVTVALDKPAPFASVIVPGDNRAQPPQPQIELPRGTQQNQQERRLINET